MSFHHSVTFLKSHRSLLLATRRPGTGRDCPCRHTAPCRPRGKTPEDDKISDSDNDQDDDHLDLEHPGLEAPSLSPHSGAAGPPQLALGAISFSVTAANLQRENVGSFHNFSCMSIFSPSYLAPCLVAAHGALGHFLHELPGLAGAVATWCIEENVLLEIMNEEKGYFILLETEHERIMNKK